MYINNIYISLLIAQLVEQWTVIGFSGYPLDAGSTPAEEIII